MFIREQFDQDFFPQALLSLLLRKLFPWWFLVFPVRNWRKTLPFWDLLSRNFFQNLCDIVAQNITCLINQPFIRYLDGKGEYFVLSFFTSYFIELLVGFACLFSTSKDKAVQLVSGPFWPIPDKVLRKMTEKTSSNWTIE